MDFFELRRNALSPIQARKLFGGTEYNCKCNGVPTGTSSTPEGCASKCSSCVDGGGCNEVITRNY